MSLDRGNAHICSATGKCFSLSLYRSLSLLQPTLMPCDRMRSRQHNTTHKPFVQSSKCEAFCNCIFGSLLSKHDGSNNNRREEKKSKSHTVCCALLLLFRSLLSLENEYQF